jgi:hypothetical protein
MNGFNSKITGWLALLVGLLGILAVISLVIFFVGLFQNISSLSFMGELNDKINAVTGILSAALATALQSSLRQFAPRLSLALLIGTWAGAFAVAFGSWLVVTGRTGFELAGYYYFFGNGLIGFWLWMLNRIMRRQNSWPRKLNGLGLIAGAFMMVGLLGLYGILAGLDGGGYSPLMMITGISFLGIGVLYPIWCLQLGGWILSKRENMLLL